MTIFTLRVPNINIAPLINYLLCRLIKENCNRQYAIANVRKKFIYHYPSQVYSQTHAWREILTKEKQ